jgi:geranylgeranyl pyrophosphate synthase
MEDIVDFLKDKQEFIDSQMRKYLPEKLDKEYMEWAFGKSRYCTDVDTIQKCISDPIWDFLSRGGKRWRPALFLLITDALGGNIEKIKEFVIVPEFTHNGSIMIDDIEDLGELRRGKPCTHKIFGVDVAINAGNFMYILPMLAFTKNRGNFDPEILIDAYEIFTQEMINIHLGQGMDIWWHRGNDHTLTEDQYLQMCAYKTGTLARMSAKLAATFSGGNKEQIVKLGNFAETIGVAFQIQDDVLSASGKEFAEKKGFGDDITEGKRTLIVINTLNKATPEDRQRLFDILDMHTRDKSLITEAISLLEKYDSINYAKELAKKIIKNAWEEVEPLLPETDAKSFMKSFAEFMINRDI